MYISDPSVGRQRRALLKDKIAHYRSRTQKLIDSRIRDARNRLAGLQAEANQPSARGGNWRRAFARFRIADVGQSRRLARGCGCCWLADMVGHLAPIVMMVAPR
jgi:hypothetical protein